MDEHPPWMSILLWMSIPLTNDPIQPCSFPEPPCSPGKRKVLARIVLKGWNSLAWLSTSIFCSSHLFLSLDTDLPGLVM